MSTFWFSRKNLRRTIHNIMVLFAAVDGDLDEFEAEINKLNGKINEIRHALVSTETSYISDDLYDASGDAILDSYGESIQSYTKWNNSK